MKLIGYLKIIYYNIIFTYKIHIKWLSKENAVLENLVMPAISAIFYILVANYISNGDIIYYVSGAICFTAVDSSIGGVSTLISAERRFGTLHTMIGSVYNPVFSLLGRIIYWCTVGYVRFLSTYFSLFLLFYPSGITFKSFILYSIIYFLISASLSGIGYMIGIIGLMKRNIMGITNIITSVLLLISGVYFSNQSFPATIRWISYLSPLYYGTSLCRNVIVYHVFSTVMMDLCLMLGLGIVYFIIGVHFYDKIEKYILKNSLLDSF